MNTITYSDQFLEDLEIKENTLIITGYEFLYQENPDILRGKTEGLEVLYEDSNKNLQILIDFLGFNIYNSDQLGDDLPGYLDIISDTGETEYIKLHFFYCVYPGGEEKLAFTLSDSINSIDDLCVTRNIFEITLPSQAKASIIGIKSDNLKFLEGPGKDVGSNLWIDGVEPKLESMVSRDGYYRYTRIENAKTSGSLSWSSEGSRVYQEITTRRYENLQLDFGNFSQDPRSDIWVRDDLSISGGIFYLHGTIDYIDYSESLEEIGRGTLPVESIPELEIQGIGNTSKFIYTIDNFSKSISYSEVSEEYNLQYGVFQVYIPSFISGQKEIYSSKFKLIIGLPEITWTFNPQTEDVEDDGLSVIVLNGKSRNTKDVLFTTNIPLEYLNDTTCEIEVSSSILYEYFEFSLDFSENNNLSECILTITALEDNTSSSWVPQDESGNPYLITFKCSIDNYSQSMYIAQYPKTPDLVVLDLENREVDTLIIPEYSIYSQFTIGVRGNENFKIWNSKLTVISSLIERDGFFIKDLFSGNSITSGNVYFIPETEDPKPGDNYRYEIVGNIGYNQLLKDELLGRIEFTSSPEKEDEETQDSWRNRVGGSSVTVDVFKKSEEASFYWGGKPGIFMISSISLSTSNNNIYYLPIYTNRLFKVTLSEAKSVSLYPESTESELIIANGSEGNSIILYNKNVNRLLWTGGIIGSQSFAGKLIFESLATDLPEGTQSTIEISIYRYPIDGEGGKYYIYNSYNDLFPIKYASEYKENYNYLPSLNRFGTIDNCFENENNSLFARFYYTSSTDSTITSVVGIKPGIYGGNSKSCRYYYTKESNQEASVEIICNKAELDINDFYFPTTPIAYVKVENWKPYINSQVVSGEIVIGGLFMRPFSNNFWYRIKVNDDPWGNLFSNTHSPEALIFDEIAGRTTIQIEIYSRYSILEIESGINACSIVDELPEGESIITYNGVDQSGDPIERELKVVKENSEIQPDAYNYFCRNLTTYTITALKNNSGVINPYIVFKDITLTSKIYKGTDLSKFINEESLEEGIYNNEYYVDGKGHRGEKYTAEGARKIWNAENSSGGLMSIDSLWNNFSFSLVQKGSYASGLVLSPSNSFNSSIPPSGSNGENWYFLLKAEKGIVIDQITSVNTGIILGQLSESGDKIPCSILGIIQNNAANNSNALWSNYYTQENPGVFQYSSPEFNLIASSISIYFHSIYQEDETLRTVTNYSNEWRQYGYTNAVYFCLSGENEKFGIGIYNDDNNNPGILDIETRLDGRGQTLETLIGLIDINTEGVTNPSLGFITISSFDGSSYSYDASSGYYRGGSRTNLSLVFPPNNTNDIKEYSLIVEQQDIRGEVIHKLLIRFKQELYIPNLDFVNSTGTTILTGGLHIFSDGTIQGGYGIGNTGGDLGCLYIKTNLPENFLPGIRLNISGSSIEEELEDREITKLINSNNEVYYKIKFKFYPNKSRYNLDTRDLDGYATGNLDIIYDDIQLNSESISTTQYCFAIELQYFEQNSISYIFPIVPSNKIHNHSQIYTIENLRVGGETIPYTISNKNGDKSCFQIYRIYCSDPERTIDYSVVDKSLLRRHISDAVSIYRYNISNTSIFTGFFMELILENTEYEMGNASPYIWASYELDNYEEEEIDGLLIGFTIKIYYTGEGDDNLIYLFEDENGKYQLFTFQYFCKKLVTQ